MRIEELLKILEKEYPDKATILKGMSELEVKVYLAKLELISYIKVIGER